MDKGVVKKFLSKRSSFLFPIIFLLVLAGPTILQMDTIIEDMPLSIDLRQIIQNTLSEFNTSLSQPSYMLMILLIPIMLLAYYQIKKRHGDNLKSRFYQPRRLSGKISNLGEQNVKIVALAPHSFFSKLIDKLYKEITNVYGNIPLWVRYDFEGLSNSWSLKSVKAVHSVHVYGENMYVQKFVDKLNEKLQILLKNTPSDIIHIYSIDVTSRNLNKKENDIASLYPKDVRNLVSKGSGANFANILGLLSAIVLAILANELWKKRESQFKKENSMIEMKVTQDALEVVRRLGGRNQELEKVEEREDGWAFKFTNYEVFATRSGFITYVRRCM